MTKKPASRNYIEVRHEAVGVRRARPVYRWAVYLILPATYVRSFRLADRRSPLSANSLAHSVARVLAANRGPIEVYEWTSKDLRLEA
jgi:hypothetical protein